MPRANHTVLVRIPVALGDDGSLFCVGEVPPHSILTLLQSPQQGSRETVTSLIESMKQLTGGVSGKDMLLFYCAGRRLHLGIESAETEIQDLVVRSSAGRMAGAHQERVVLVDASHSAEFLAALQSTSVVEVDVEYPGATYV